MKKITGIYLAAGKSTRMQESKLHLPAGKHSLGSMALKQALLSKLDSTVIVTRSGADIEWIAPELYHGNWKTKWKTIESEHAEKGQAYSLKSGIEEAEAGGADAIVVLLADQPFVTAERINQLISTCGKHLQDYAALERLQPPLLLEKQLFPRLKQLEGDEGARNFLRRDTSLRGTFLASTNDLLFYDIDTKEDYQWLLQKVPS